ncbi:MAG: hypothetical protein AAF763_16760 [Pseudomonadota bacterium]
MVLAEGAEGLLGARAAEYEQEPWFEQRDLYLWSELEVRGALDIELAEVFFNLSLDLSISKTERRSTATTV